MGGAYTAAANGISGVPYNPASVAFINNQAAFLSQTQYVADISYSVMGYGRDLSGEDFVGVHIFSLDYTVQWRLLLKMNLMVQIKTLR